MPKALVVGYGNPLRGDDGVGWVVAEKLREILPDKQVLIRTCVQLTPELALDLSEVEVAVFIDAKCAEPVGSVECVSVSPSPVSQTFSHHFTPSTLLAYTQQFFGKAPQTFLVSVNGKDFGFQTQLSQPVQNAVPAVIKVVQDLLEHLDIVLTNGE